MSATMIALAVLCGLNLVALAVVLRIGRHPHPARRDLEELLAERRSLEEDPPARRTERATARPSVEDLVQEAEEAERLAARGESRLAADLARWRRSRDGALALRHERQDGRAAGGNDLPAAAAGGRLAAGVRS